jgi:hypothetical protein
LLTVTNQEHHKAGTLYLDFNAALIPDISQIIRMQILRLALTLMYRQITRGFSLSFQFSGPKA